MNEVKTDLNGFKLAPPLRELTKIGVRFIGANGIRGAHTVKLIEVLNLSWIMQAVDGERPRDRFCWTLRSVFASRAIVHAWVVGAEKKNPFTAGGGFCFHLPLVRCSAQVCVVSRNRSSQNKGLSLCMSLHWYHREHQNLTVLKYYIWSVYNPEEFIFYLWR